MLLSKREFAMPLHKIDHVTINSADLDRTCAFYGDVLGFGVQKMEGRGYTGAWLLLSGHPFVHVVARRPQQTPDTTGILDHFALEATDIPGTRAHLSKAGVPFRENALPEFELHQIVVRDPDGVKVELNFRGQSG
jgi:catechol 2,3-dioxygenase-like lactoylglutathione lyase family enzyme